ncbi:MerR family transcriptional regulator [Brevibacillus brevis]|uniref:MerR family transcriptional regulator n=1 Tax=Brevibacillus brevis TaxID=1393 RepID=UPI000B38F4A0|nr:MerR family transcriptional regulator [Brevibacillus brevis]OUQ86522.1 MerR family transcriptional regulator [Brevibacillus brevis]
MNEERTYSISEVAEQTGLSTDTLRYYEKIGLLASPTRGGGQKRMYDEGDIGRIRFLNHLRRTDMPLKKIKEYVEHYSLKDDAHCYALLDAHREAIELRISELNATAEIIRYKLKHFQEIKDGHQKEEKEYED